MLASTITELTRAVGAADANAVPATITARSGASVGSSRKRRKMRTPRTGKQRGSSNDYDDDSNSSGGNSNSGALMISAVLKLAGR